MKLKHRITGTILAIAFATTTALPAAAIPQLKNPPKAVAKVPSAPVAPRIPTVPKVVKAPVAPKIPVTPKVVSTPKAPVAPRVPVVSMRPPQINTGKLNHLKLKLPVEMKPVQTRSVNINGVITEVASGARGKDFVKDNFGPGGQRQQAGNFIDGVKNNGGGGRDRNPLSRDPKSGMIVTKGAALSDNPGNKGKSGNGTQTSDTKPSRNVSFEGAVITPSGVTYLDKRPNVAAPFVSDVMYLSTSYGSIPHKLGQGNKKEPAPDDTGYSGPTIVTKDDIKGIEAKKNRHSEPTEEQQSNGGHINNGASGTGRQGSVSLPAGDEVRAAARLTGEDMRAMEVRINARINTGSR